MFLHGSRGRRYGILDRIAGGGEGDLYSIAGDMYHVAKLYKVPNAQREEKVLAMLSSPLRDSTLLAWPKDALYDADGRFRGFIMDRIYGGDPISAIYEIGSKAKYSMTPWTHRVIIAINLCCALNAVHDAGQVIGDFNPNNMFVNMRSGHVKLVDTDSYHVTSGGRQYSCSVAMPNYLAPEIARRLSKGRTLESLKAPTFTESSDNFSLAIHIYQLLMNGTHPFQGALRPGSDVNLPNIRDNILSHTVPSIGADKDIVPPSYSPSFRSLPKDLQDLFKRAFLSEKDRPTSKEWHSALIGYRRSMKQCRKNPVHHYHESLNRCPLCLAEVNYQRALGKVATSRKHNPHLTFYESAYYPEHDGSLPNDSMYSFAESLIIEQAPVDETYLMDMCRRARPKDPMSKDELRAMLRESFFHVDDRPFVTYVTAPAEYDNFSQYRRMPDGKRARSIAHVSYLDMRNAMLSVIRDRGAAHITYLISESERRLGLRHGSIRSTRRLNRVAEVLIRSRLIAESNDIYRFV